METKPASKFYCGCKNPRRRAKVQPAPEPPPPPPNDLEWEGEEGVDVDTLGPDEFRQANHLEPPHRQSKDSRPGDIDDDLRETSAEEPFDDTETEAEEESGRASFSSKTSN